MKHAPAMLAITLAVSILTCVPTHAFADREHQVKSVLIYDIAIFCQWDGLGAPGTPFVIGLYKAESYGNELDAVMSGRSVLGHPISVRRLKSTDDLSQCRIVVIGDIHGAAVRELAKQLRNSGTLLIGESVGFAESGGGLGFILRDRNIHFEVNLRTVELDHVSLGSKLLSLATEVYR